MNAMKWFLLFMRVAPIIPQLIDAYKNGTLVEFLKTQGSGLWSALLEIVKELFPGLAPEQAVQAAVLVAFDPSTVKKIQSGLNRLGQSPVLVEDGDYGPKTKAAVEAFQKAHDLVVDGWAGPKTETAVQVEVNKLAE